ncbi:hypothetical protein PPACK8108_LOCUS14616 [Phakopsora pachyrhizi]|uniref:Uncharacterized protein n=1 Tax=Phakopsora pachyrhizi TaxID=170000 RepID=A0AAV0B8K8_PHAPC|nr:hypothetical protein PPACK8108_LOCUS14616 [Phakopsora pachyrhizi]
MMFLTGWKQEICRGVNISRVEILKPPPPPKAIFNFKCDMLNPFSSKLGNAALEESPLEAVVGAGGGLVGLGVQAPASWFGSAWKKLGAPAVIEKAKINKYL